MKTSEVDITVTVKRHASVSLDEVADAIKTQLSVESWLRDPQSLTGTLADIAGVEIVEVRP